MFPHMCPALALMSPEPELGPGGWQGRLLKQAVIRQIAPVLLLAWYKRRNGVVLLTK